MQVFHQFPFIRHNASTRHTRSSPQLSGPLRLLKASNDVLRVLHLRRGRRENPIGQLDRRRMNQRFPVEPELLPLPIHATPLRIPPSTPSRSPRDRGRSDTRRPTPLCRTFSRPAPPFAERAAARDDSSRSAPSRGRSFP